MRRIGIKRENVNFTFFGRAKIYFWMIALGFIVVNVFFTIQTATVGSELAGFEEEEKKLAAQNQDLRDSLVKKMSLAKLKEKGEEIGFSTPTIVYLKTENTFADLGQR